MNQHLADTKAPVCQLEFEAHFNKLNDKEQKYAHHMSRASHWGTRAVLRSVSPESEDIYDMILAIYESVGGDLTKLPGSEEDIKYFKEYASQFLVNGGNFKSFGDVKFVPRLSEQAFRKIAELSPKSEALFDTVKEPLYSTQPQEANLLGFPDHGHVSAYYSSNITKDEIEAVQNVLSKNGILAENTRLFKNDDGFVLKIASADTHPNGEFKNEYDVNGAKLVLQYGDHNKEFKHIVAELAEARKYAANEHQQKMLDKYIESFKTGSMDAHVNSQRHWIKDMGPKVETNIGFIETYRDPAGVRGEWEGFVAMVNKEQTEKFSHMVKSAEKYTGKLPWPREFEKDKFQAPDFSSLEVMTFASSGPPAGINLPNFDVVRQSEGFKNVSLGNVLSAKAPNEKLTFLTEEDEKLSSKLKGPAFEVQVGIHELLGHGSGKLLQEHGDGSCNFDRSNPPVSPLTNKKVDTWYKAGETWGSVFGAIAASYEECRAEAVAMHLSTDKSLLEIFGHTGQDADDIMYVGWLQMARAGLLALEFWDPTSKKWGQAHMQARYAIFQCFLEAGEGFVTLESSKPDYSDLVVKMDRSKIETVGQRAIAAFLQKLQIYKATADLVNGSAFYNLMTEVGDMAKYRDAVLAAKLPRKQFVMANSEIKDDKVALKIYDPSYEGVIQSYAERRV